MSRRGRDAVQPDTSPPSVTRALDKLQEAAESAALEVLEADRRDALAPPGVLPLDRARDAARRRILEAAARLRSATAGPRVVVNRAPTPGLTRRRGVELPEPDLEPCL